MSTISQGTDHESTFESLISPVSSVLSSLGAGMESKHDENLYTPSLQLGATKWHHRPVFDTMFDATFTTYLLS
jgi:hypothetical protein